MAHILSSLSSQTTLHLRVYELMSLSSLKKIEISISISEDHLAHADHRNTYNKGDSPGAVNHLGNYANLASHAKRRSAVQSIKLPRVAQSRYAGPARRSFGTCGDAGGGACALK